MSRRSLPVAVAVIMAVPGPLPAAAASVPAVEEILAGGAGDGGPASAAQVNALAVAVGADGDQWFYDRLSRQVRRIDARTGVVTAAFGNPGPVPAPATSFDPPLPYAAVTGLWPLGGELYLDAVAADGRHGLVRVGADGRHSAPLDVLGPAEPGDVLTVRLVRRDGSMVVDWRRLDGPWTTELVPADGGVRTRLADHGTRSAAEAADGTVVLLGQDGSTIDRMTPQGALERLAGNGRGPAQVNRPATATPLQADLVTITPDGHRVVFAERTPSGPRLLGFEPGGPVTRVAEAVGVRAADRVCDADLTTLAAGDAGVYSACGGPVRRHDSAPGPETPPGPGTIVAGANRLRGWADSPPGTPAAGAYLGHVRDVATDPRGRVAMATRGGVYELRAGRLELLLAGLPGDDPDAPFVTGSQRACELTVNECQFAVDIDFGPDGTLYALAPGPGPRGWLLRAVRPGARPVAVAGGGTRRPETGGSGLSSRLGPGHLAVSADGGTAYVSQTATALVWALDLASGRLARVAGGGLGGRRDDVPAVAASLAAPTWLGRDPAGDLLVSDGNLHRLDAGGVLRAVPAGAGPTYAVTPDGSAWSARAAARTLWRRQPDGAYVRAALPVVRPRIAAGPGGRLLVADSPGATSRVRTAAPAAPTAWPGGAPQLSVAAGTDGHGRLIRVTATLPEAPGPWHVVVRLAASPRRPGPDLGAVVLDRTVSAGGGSRTAVVRALAPGAHLTLGLYATTAGGAAAAPPAVEQEVVLP